MCQLDIIPYNSKKFKYLKYTFNTAHSAELK